ncbi:hypothetical protein PAPHI01_1728 [Pancytospora philotis]|nr:hypothetical protein PAPHI01_1728 [Pancytospora philotis]
MASTKIIAIGACLVAFGIVLGGGCWYWGRESPSEPAAPAEASPADASAASTSTSSAGKRELDIVPSFELRAPSARRNSPPTHDEACEVLCCVLEMLGQLLSRVDVEYWKTCETLSQVIHSRYSRLEDFIHAASVDFKYNSIELECAALEEEKSYNSLKNAFANGQSPNILYFLYALAEKGSTCEQIIQILGSNDKQFEQKRVSLARIMALYSNLVKDGAGHRDSNYLDPISHIDFDAMQNEAFKYISSEGKKFKHATKAFAGTYVMDALAAANVSDPKVLKFASTEEKNKFCNNAGAENCMLHSVIFKGDAEDKLWHEFSSWIKGDNKNDPSGFKTVMQLAGARSEKEFTPGTIINTLTTRRKLLAILVDHAMRCYQQVRRDRVRRSRRSSQ